MSSTLKKLSELHGSDLYDASIILLNQGIGVDGLEKAAGVAGEAKNLLSFSEGLEQAFPKAIANASVTAGIGGGLIGAQYLAQKAHQKKLEESKATGFEAMLTKNPDLAKSEKPEQVIEEYETLHKFAPSIAEHPHAAGSYIRNSLRYQNEGTSLDVIANLSKIQQGHEGTQGAMLNVNPMGRLAVYGPRMA